MSRKPRHLEDMLVDNPHEPLPENDDGAQKAAYDAAIREYLQQQAAKPGCISPMRTTRWLVRHRNGKAFGLRAK
jgi:hypothetical protein